MKIKYNLQFDMSASQYTNGVAYAREIVNNLKCAETEDEQCRAGRMLYGNSLMYRNVFIKNDSILAIAAALKNWSNDYAKSYCVSAIGEICKKDMFDDLTKLMVVESGVLESLVDILQHENVDYASCACKTISALTRNPYQNEKLREIPNIMNILEEAERRELKDCKTILIRMHFTPHSGKMIKAARC